MAEYPTGISYKADRSAFRVLEAYAPPVMSEFEDGPHLGRRSHIGQRAKLAYRIIFWKLSEYETFRLFARDTLVDGTMRFTMPVWTPATGTYVTKTVQLDRGLYTAERLGLGMAVNCTLIVYDW